jgi:hypothetical protein
MSDNAPAPDLIGRLRAGDGRTAADFFRHYEPVLRSHIRVWLRMQDARLRRVFDSMDICQSVLASFFVRAASGQYDLDQPDQLLALLLQMARHKADGANDGGRKTMKRLAIALLLLVSLFAARVNGQPKVGQVQPDRIVFDKVYSGATVEASFLVFAAPNADGNTKFAVTAPPYVKVLRKDTDISTAGGGQFLRGSVEFALDTSKIGEFTGQIAVQLNGTSVQVPVSASVKPQHAGLLRLLVVETPFQKFSTSDGGHFRQWTDLAASNPWDVNYLLTQRDQPVLRDLDLSDFGAVLLGPEGVWGMQPAEVKRVRAYVEDGGSLILFANAFFRGTVEKANTLLAPYGVVMADEEARDGSGEVTIEKTAIDPQLVQAGIERVTFFRASPATVSNPMLAKVLVKAAHVGQLEDGFVTTVNARNGKIIVIGQSLWWNWVSSGRDPSGGNAKLLQWIFTSAHQRRQRFLGLKQPLSTAQMADCWANLAADDFDEASEARCWLTRAPGADRQTVPFLKGQLSPVPPADTKRLELLIAQLNDDAFQTREKAQRELEVMGDSASAILQRTLEAKPSAEVRRRIEGILDKVRPLSREQRQYLRAIDVLEQLATPDAKALLRALSEGAPGTRVTGAAQEALDRLASASEPSSKPEPTSDKRP